jgi:hypothetical protein
MAARKKEAPSVEPPPEDVTLTYEKVTLSYQGVDMHVDRIEDGRYRLYARLNYITAAQMEWTYDETVEGTPDEVYAHATARIRELAELKPKHDAVHDRVRRMSEGVP